MINVDKVVEIEVVREFNESSLARILVLVQEATSRKARTEQFIRRFAKVYTPIVTFLAIALALFPFFFIDNYVLEDWLYRAFVFMVISCPCSLFIQIPIGFFGGIGGR